MMCLVRLNNTMKRLLMSMAIIISLMIPVKANSEIDPNYDWDNDQEYQNLAEDFRNYTTCQAIHQNLARFVTINYGVGSNLGYPAEWLEQQRLLLENANTQEIIYGDKTERTMMQLMMRYQLPYQILDAQRNQNQAGTTQSIMFAIAPGSKDPTVASNVIKGILTESSNCQAYQEKGDYVE